MKNDIIRLAELIHQARDIVVFTGAGISTESGIADYRGQGGRWQRFRPVTIQEFQASEDKRKEYWREKLELWEGLKDARPNEGHKAIAALEKAGKLKGLITQNIDGLHRLAGNSREKTIEIHGTCLETVCLSCGDIQPWQAVYKELKNGVEVPLCAKCAGLLKPNTISFGQNLNQADLQKAFAWAGDCDLMLAVGSTPVVEPAASIPRAAKQSGAALGIITLSETPLDSVADVKITEPCGKTLSSVLAVLDSLGADPYSTK